MSAISKWELCNFLRACGCDPAEAMRLKSLNISDVRILAHYKLDKKVYQRWSREYSSQIGKSVMVRKRGRLISMKCNECKGIIRFSERGERVCDNCGLIVDLISQMSERVRFALRELGRPVTNKSQKEHIQNLLTVGKSEEEVIRIISNK